MITVTQNAVKHLRHLLESKGSPEGEGLRLFVERGGCAGLQYAMKIAAPEAEDTVIAAEDVRIFIEQESIPFLQDSEVDYTESLNDSGFKINNPNAARSCGCGTSFEPAAEAPSANNAELPAAGESDRCQGDSTAEDSLPDSAPPSTTAATS